MSKSSSTTEKLFECLLVDDIQVKGEILERAKSGDGYSLSRIGDIYFNKRDYKKSIEWYLLSASTNYSYSQQRIGYMYSEGLHVTIDYNAAMEWYLRAHMNGNITAATNIGYLFNQGFGIAQNYQTALGWYLEAASKGEKYAQNNIGILYEYGRGIEQDKLYALEWFEKSADQGHLKAKESVKRLNKEGYYLNERQKAHLQMEKENKHQREKIYVLEKDCQSYKGKLKQSEHKLMVSDKENERLENQVKLLMQEVDLLKLNHRVGKIEESKANKKKDKTKRLEKTQLENKDSASDPLDNPENDLCYDE